MIELRKDALVFSFPDVHPQAKLSIDFKRTLRIPDDGRDYPLPPGLGNFPLRHIDDFKDVPESWARHGGVMLPMYQSEALWINFNVFWGDFEMQRYPFAIKVAAGKINAVTGQAWANGISENPQDYVVAPTQPWLDGFCIEKGTIRQFVAMPLGSGYTVEEQITGDGLHGGLQLVVYPMKREVYERRFPPIPREYGTLRLRRGVTCSADMGLAPGGRMKQEIYSDPYGLEDWDMSSGSRCFVHLANSLMWRQVTGENPPTVPFTPKEYYKARLPWFKYYAADTTALGGSGLLDGLKGITDVAKEKEDATPPGNDSVTPTNVIKIISDSSGNRVREGDF